MIPDRARLAALFASFAVALALPACNSAPPEPAPEPHAAASAEPEPPEPKDLIKEDLVVGSGPEAKEGDKVKVNYTGRLLKTNFMFDTSIGPGKKPFEFTIGKGQVIKGWDEGVVGMKVGGKRKLTIPSRLGYKERGSPPKIPGNATLVFEVELLEIENDTPAASASASAAAAPKAKTKTKKK
ncbi:MAG TPA: FKBP-type peptidyl-prolyl cis-trans isomerase [Minicystis sp.]|nr:FKBP-type peptidyl-prolyl cis-trans isomerase [Minicystis sp.]